VIARGQIKICARILSKFGINPTLHGFDGWLNTELALPLKALAADKKLIKAIIESAVSASAQLPNKSSVWKWLFKGKGDPNDWRLVQADATGLRYPPLATKNHHRNGTRERVLAVAAKTNNLTIELEALATRVLFDGTKAIGVEYRKGAKLYKASWNASKETGELKQVFVRDKGEVILSGGAFNTPQLLMLSGIGARKQLEDFGIEVLVDLPGVGQNLQDRYEVGVVNRMNFDCWEALKGAKFSPGDPQYQQWLKGKGVYTTNGAVLAVILRSMETSPNPDLFVFALLGLFRGYFPSYSALFSNNLNYLTWAVLKAHTNNTAGYVRLRSANPLEPPIINFKYFDEGNDESGDDLKSVVEGIKFVRKLTAPLIRDQLIAEEVMPGAAVTSDEDLATFIKDRAWGHHASCTCAIGPRENNGVLNSKFEVHGTQNLRVVDASAFPKIPGFFIVAAIYMIGEKAADVILAAANRK
jgi:choline dehydrogenase